MADPVFSEELLAGLTDEERAGLLDPDLIDEGHEEAGAEDAPQVSAEETAAAQTDEEAAAGEAPAAEVAADTTVPVVVAPEAEAAKPQPQVGGLPDYQLPEDFEARRAQLQTDQEALATKFDDGDLTAREYQTELQRLAATGRELDKIELKAELAEDSRKQSEATRQQSYESSKDTWLTGTVPEWLGTHTNYEEGTAAYNALNAEVFKLQNEAVKANGDMFAPSILDQAHANVQRELRKALGLPEPEGGAAPKVPAKPSPPAREIPPSLAAVPAAAEADFDADGSKFAVIARMDGIDKENAMAALSPSEYQKYMQSPYS